MSGKRVLFIVTDTDTGGAEVFLAGLCEQLVEKGLDCTVVSLSGFGEQAGQLKRAGCRLVPGRSRSVAGLVHAVSLCRRMITEWRPDVVQGWMYHGNLVATLATLPNPSRLAWSVHHALNDIESESARLRWGLAVLKKLSRWPRMIHYCARSSARQHERIGFHPQHTVVVPNGIDVERFVPAADDRTEVRLLMGFDIPPEADLIGHVGRYHPTKDHESFLRAAALLASRRPDSHFVLIGPGVTENNPTLVSLREELGLSARMRFLGERGDVHRLLRGMDLFSISSRGEAFPIALGEAMAAGVPCVATDVGDCAHLIGDTGRVVPPRRPDLLADAWMELMSEDATERRARGQRARGRILDHFDIREIASRFDQALDAHLGRP